MQCRLWLDMKCYASLWCLGLSSAYQLSFRGFRGAFREEQNHMACKLKLFALFVVTFVTSEAEGRASFR